MKKLVLALLIIVPPVVAVLLIGWFLNTGSADSGGQESGWDKSANVGDVDLSAADKCPTRIVSLAPNLTEILFALGLEDKIVAVSTGSNYPPAAEDKKKIGSFWQPSTESVIAARPDLVFTLKFPQQLTVARNLRGADIPVLSVEIENIGDLYSAIAQAGSVTGRDERAEELVKSIKNRVEAIRSRTHKIRPVPTLWVVQKDPLRLAGRNSFINTLIELAGGRNVIDETSQQYPSISTEDIITCGAEVIIHSKMENQSPERQKKAAVEFWSKWPNIPAVDNERIYILDSDLLLRLGPRLAQGLRNLAAHLHPEAFAEDRRQNSSQPCEKSPGGMSADLQIDL